MARSVAHEINAMLPGKSREKSLALAELEAATCWATAVLVHTPV